MYSPLYRFTPLIICRFILNLRQVKSDSSGSSWISDGGRNSGSVSLRFVGNAGESVRFGLSDKEEEDVADCVDSQVEELSDMNNGNDREHMI